jgi:hypothetical protein
VFPSDGGALTFYEFIGKGANRRSFVEPTLLPGVEDRILLRAGRNFLRPGEGPVGIGIAPRTFPPEVVWWFALVDLYSQMENRLVKESKHSLLGMRKTFSESDQAGGGTTGMLEAQSRTIAFRLLGGDTVCQARIRIYSDESTGRLSIIDRWRGHDPEDIPQSARRSDDATRGTSQELMARMTGEMRGERESYELEIHHVFEVHRTSEEAVMERHIRCESPFSLFAMAQGNLVWVAEDHGDNWHVRVQQLPGKKSLPESGDRPAEDR